MKLALLYNNQELMSVTYVFLTLSWRRPLSYRNQSIDQSNGLRHERVKKQSIKIIKLRKEIALSLFH